MSGDSGKPFDPLAQVAELQAALFGGIFNPLKMLGPASLLRYETIDPQVQEIAIIATMHNMASMLRDPGRIKAVLSAELAERAKKLDGK
jgi:hypothetical protein